MCTRPDMIKINTDSQKSNLSWTTNLQGQLMLINKEGDEVLTLLNKVNIDCKIWAALNFIAQLCNFWKFLIWVGVVFFLFESGFLSEHFKNEGGAFLFSFLFTFLYGIILAANQELLDYRSVCVERLEKSRATRQRLSRSVNLFLVENRDALEKFLIGKEVSTLKLRKQRDIQVLDIVTEDLTSPSKNEQ